MSIFTRDMAKEVLLSRKDRILEIPDGVTELSEDFALLFDEDDEMLHFFEIHIPASVTSIPGICVTEYDSVLMKYIIDCFDTVIVDPKNTHYCSENGVLLTYDRAGLVYYPCGKKDSVYEIPKGVQVICNDAFGLNNFLIEVIIPSTLKSIQHHAFDGCIHLQQIQLPAGLENIDEDAFGFCDILHLVLPQSLKSIHWSVLAGMGTGIHVLESTSPDLQVDMAGYSPMNQIPYDRPLLLINSSPSIEKFASRFHKNYFTDYIRDESGIVWSSDKKTLISFPANSNTTTYHVPDGTEHIFRWAFNDSRTVTQIITSSPVDITGRTVGEDYSKLTDERKPITLSIKQNQPVIHTCNTVFSGGKSSYIFISYSSHEQNFADSVRSLLKSSHMECWMAPYDIPAGSKYASVINSALENCSCLLLLLSNASQNSQFVEREVERAITYRKQIISMQIEDMILNSGFKFYLGSEQIVPVYDLNTDSPELQKILQSLHTILNSEP